jgi:GGDEF domain-containing protein
MTASFGIATYPDDADSKDKLIRLADQAMYRVKETSRDAVMSA